MMIRKIFLLIVLLCSFSENVFACRVGWRPSAELVKEATVVLDATVVSAEPGSSSFRGNNYNYTVNVKNVERGISENTKAIVVKYELLRAHVRGETRVCPTNHGSGIEHQLQVGGTYRLYL